MRRRRLLAFGAALSSFAAGCLGNGGDAETSTETPTGTASGDDPTPTPDVHESHAIGDTVSTPVGDVTVESVTVQKSVIDRAAFRILHREEGVQYLLVEAGEVPPDFVPVFDEYPYEPASQQAPTGPDSAYILGVDIERPAPAATAAVALEADPDIRWQLPEETVERLTNRPEIRILDGEVVERNGESAFRLELENTGDRDGVFRAIVVSPVGADIDDEITTEVPEGETVTETFQNPVIEDWGVGYDLGSIEPNQRSFGEGG